MPRQEYINKILFFEKKLFLLVVGLFCMLTISFPSQISAKDKNSNYPFKETCFAPQDKIDFPLTLASMEDIDENNPAKMYVLAMNLALNQAFDSNEIVKLLEKSAQKGCGNAKMELWYRYAVGDGVAQNNATATLWAKDALNNDYGSVQIGRWFMYISGAEQDVSPEWDRLVSYDDVPEVLYHLGLMYATGLGIKQNYVSASKWYNLAAKKGYPQAQYNLGILYALGHGVNIDNIRAYALIDLATQNGHEQADGLRNVLRKSLDEKQIKMANRFASNFLAK